MATIIDLQRPVRVFKNLKHECYSIMQAGRICASAKQVQLRSVEFRVRASGRERARREGKPNVHAFVVGQLMDYVHPDDERCLLPIGGRAAFYNPYLVDGFVDSETRAPITTVEIIHLDETGLTYHLRDGSRAA